MTVPFCGLVETYRGGMGSPPPTPPAASGGRGRSGSPLLFGRPVWAGTVGRQLWPAEKHGGRAPGHSRWTRGGLVSIVKEDASRKEKEVRH